MKERLTKFMCSCIIGHKVNPKNTDSGYYFCERCGRHEYYDGPFYTYALFEIHLWLKNRTTCVYYRIKDLFNKESELPF